MAEAAENIEYTPIGSTEPVVDFAPTPAPTEPSKNFLADSGYDPAKTQGVMADLATARGQKREQESYVDRTEMARMEADRAKMEKAYAAQGAAKDAMPPPWNADKERAERIRGPMEQFGSIGSVFAMAASLFTRTPMTSALNAGAAAMQSIQNHDEKGYESAYQAWKANTDLALHRFNMERSMFEDANKLMASDMNSWRARRLAIASQYEDTKAITMLNNGMDAELLQLDAAKIDAAVKLQKAQQGFEEYELQRQLFKQGKAAFKEANPNATPAEDVKNSLELLHSIKSAEKGLSNYNTIKPEQLYLQQRVPELVQSGLSPSEAIRQAEREYQEAHKPPSTQALTKDKADAQELTRRRDEYVKQGMDPTAAYDKAREEILNKAKATFTDDELKTMAEQYIAGDKSVFQNVRTGGASGYANLVALRKKVLEVAKEQKLSGADLATRMAEFSGMMAAQRTLGTRTANVEMFNNEAINQMQIVRDTSKAFKRTEFPPINTALVAYEKGTGNVEVRRFGAAINTLVNTYAKAINGGGQGTVSDKEHARELLRDIDTPDQIEGVLDILKQELEAARRAPGQVRQELRDLSGSGSTIEKGKVPPAPNVIEYDNKGKRIKKSAIESDEGRVASDADERPVAGQQYAAWAGRKQTMYGVQKDPEMWKMLYDKAHQKIKRGEVKTGIPFEVVTESGERQFFMQTSDGNIIPVSGK